MASDDVRIAFPSTPSQRIIAAGIVIAFCYWASSVLVTLALAVLIAYFLDPLVTWLEDRHLPRALGSLLILLLTISLIGLLGWTLLNRLDEFGTDWPKYRAPIRAARSAKHRRCAPAIASCRSPGAERIRRRQSPALFRRQS